MVIEGRQPERQELWAWQNLCISLTASIAQSLWGIPNSLGSFLLNHRLRACLLALFKQDKSRLGLHSEASDLFPVREDRSVRLAGLNESCFPAFRSDFQTQNGRVFVICLKSDLFLAAADFWVQGQWSSQLPLLCARLGTKHFGVKERTAFTTALDTQEVLNKW